MFQFSNKTLGADIIHVYNDLDQTGNNLGLMHFGTLQESLKTENQPAHVKTVLKYRIEEHTFFTILQYKIISLYLLIPSTDCPKHNFRNVQFLITGSGNSRKIFIW